MKTCKTCRFWKHGACSYIDMEIGDSPQRFEIELPPYDDCPPHSLMTGPEFGCVHHSSDPKDRPEKISGLLAGTEVAPGHCVIVNDCDKPCAWLVAVVTEVSSRRVWCKYLCKDTDLAKYNKYGQGRGVENPLGVVCPVSSFGIQVMVFSSMYHCVQLSPSWAKYPDGTIRKWQDSIMGIYRPYNPEVFKLAKYTPMGA